jgi:hypothetical protein
MSGNYAQIGEQMAKLQTERSPELRNQEEKREWHGDELMSEGQARRLREVSRKRNLKMQRKMRRQVP